MIKEPSMSDNLWPDFHFEEGEVRSPKSVIKEAGRGLDEKTDHIVRFYTMHSAIDSSTAELTFSFYVRNLNYHFPFMRVSFAVDTFYPVRIIPDKMDPIV